MKDPELLRLLASELRRHVAALAEDRDEEDSRRTLHALKGSSGLAGEPELADALARLERRLREGDPSARADARTVVEAAIVRIEAGQSAYGLEWPQPPPDLRAAELDGRTRAQYIAEVVDRVERIDAALSGSGDPVERLADAFRHVHTMKGAAGAVGDEVMTWFCHGLEERLRIAGNHPERCERALAELGRYRPYLVGLVEDPAATLALLRNTRIERGTESTFPGREASIRVRAQAIDTLLERMASLGLLSDALSSARTELLALAKGARGMRGELSDALRLIGPPRPWGAPLAAIRKIERSLSSLTSLTDELERGARASTSAHQTLGETAGAVTKGLAAMRQTQVRELFQRLTTAVETEGRKAARQVRVVTSGADELVDRKLLDRLIEPCLQIARNSIAHGIEQPHVREARGKSRQATLRLSATRSGNRLVIGIDDDGSGVNPEKLRAQAIATGTATAEVAQAADTSTLLSLLFVPGFSTQSDADLLAGRGVGLDLALVAIQRLGGTIRLESEEGVGFKTRIFVPLDTVGLARVLWVKVGTQKFALPCTDVRSVDLANEEYVPHLLTCIANREATGARYTLTLNLGVDSMPEEDALVGIDEVGGLEEVVIRPLAPLVAALGPYAGAVARAAGSARMVLDAHAVAVRARAIARLHAESIS